MSLETETVKLNPAPLLDFFAERALRRVAKNLVRTTRTCTAAAKEVLYGLPGIFCMALCVRNHTVRLIKEADLFRIADEEEKATPLLTITFKDVAILKAVADRRTPISASVAEGRVSFRGQTRFFATLMRVSGEGDKRHPTERED